MNFQYLELIKFEKKNFTLHTLRSPEDGEWVNAHVIETKNKLVIVDTLQLKPYANEFRKYVDSLGKPVEKLFVTHYHPDHWFGLASFKDLKAFALHEVIDKIAAMADFVLGYHRQQHGAEADKLLPSEKVIPTEEIKEGELVVDGVKLNLIKIVDTEAPVILIVEIPEEKILICQDLVYNKAYSYFGDRLADDSFCFDPWIAVLKSFKAKNYELIIPAHGVPDKPHIIDTEIEFLEFSKKQVMAGLQGDDLVNSIKNQYPGYKLPLTLVMSDVMLFKFGR